MSSWKQAALSAVIMMTGGWFAIAVAGDAENGHQLARGSDSAPPFAEIAKDQTQTAEHLKSWLNQSHPAMPDLMISRDRNDDLVSYILSLQGN